MAIPRRFTIAESSHRILDPMTPARLDELGDALHLTPGTTMLDLACGKGELLCRWARDHGVSGTGVDINPPFVTAARDRAVELGVADRLTFVESDATGFVADEPVDIASCCGATWVGDGPIGTLALLDRSLRPGGIALVGECYWLDLPTEEVARGCGFDAVSDLGTLDQLIGDVQSAGWDLVEMTHADEHTWDRYVAAQWLNLRRFLDAHPDDEDAHRMRAELDTAPVQYVRYQRRFMGWGIFALMKK